MRRVDGAQAEVRQEGVRVLGDRGLEQRLGAREVAALVADDAREDQRLELVGLLLEHALEVVERGLGVALVEAGLAEEEQQLVVVAVELQRLLEAAPGAVDVEGVERVLGVVQVLGEDLAPVALVERRDAVLDRHEALALLERAQLVLHLRLPELGPLLAPDRAPPLEQLAQRGEAGLRHQQVLLLLVDGRDQLGDRLGRALDRLLEDRHPLEQVLVEREVGFALTLEALAVGGGGARDHQQLLVAADADLLLDAVRRSAGLAQQQGAHPPYA